MKQLSCLTVLAVLSMSGSAYATGCVADAEGIRHLYPGSWPSWTTRMEGHKGEKCWFPASSKGDKKWDPKYEDKTPEVEFPHMKVSKKDKRAKEALKKVVVVPEKVAVKTQLYTTTALAAPTPPQTTGTARVHTDHMDRQLSPAEAAYICETATKMRVTDWEQIAFDNYAMSLRHRLTQSR